MQLFSRSNSSAIFLYFTWVLVLLNLFSLSLSDPRTTEAGLFCSQTRPPPSPDPNTTFINLFVRELEGISKLVTDNGWGKYSVNISSQVFIYGLGQCHEDLSQTDCLQCYAASRTTLPRCLPFIAGRIYFDGCFIRYDNYSFYNESTNPAIDSKNCTSVNGNFTGLPTARLEFEKNVGELVDNLSREAFSNGGHAKGEWKGVYGLVQCWETLSAEGCRECLAKASREVRTCLPSRDGRGMNAGCYMRYSTEKFFSNQTDDQSSGSSSRRKKIAIALAVVAVCMLSAFAGYAIYARSRRLKQERYNLGRISHSYRRSNLNFRYETLEKATNYFDPSTKIGQGGAGSVYKGTLSNGKVVAVKRLFFSTRQWVDEFFNEVNLVSGIQHKNLVKLLGCSIEGPESLLVYEFLPNRSLEQYLFDGKDKIRVLNWKQRFNIIVGTAEGLAYLHGGAETRIIHRDIKSSNILLDENLAPKIADFGLARCFEADKTHLSTGIAGTLGYMAPEYLVKGQLTEKADVYSFGVLVLEIVCGRRSNAFGEESSSLLQTVWHSYRSDTLIECIDPCLKGDFPVKEAFEVIQIGLLCSQASPTMRPSMDEVVRMLTEKDRDIPVPNQPPFLNASLLAASSIRPSSLNNLLSNALTKLEEVSCTNSTGSSSMQSSEGPATTRNEQPR